jgi:hypothetical protein
MTERGGSASSLADPTVCGEDLTHNLRRTAELARTHCRDCADYHIWAAASRLTGRIKSTSADRPRLAALIGRQVKEIAMIRTGIIDVVIAGAADTGLLATAAHAACLAGDHILARSRFHVLDLCPTPGLLCEEFGRRHGLAVTSEAVDITRGDTSTRGDIIIMHGVLRFIERRLHANTLRRLGERLKPDGRIVLSNRLRPPSDTTILGSGSGQAILRMIADGSIESPEPLEQFRARIRRHMGNNRIKSENEIESAEAARDVFAEAGLPILLFDAFAEAAHGSGTEIRPRLRLHAVLGVPGHAAGQ